jgi:hypothetical protein
LILLVGAREFGPPAPAYRTEALHATIHSDQAKPIAGRPPARQATPCPFSRLFLRRPRARSDGCAGWLAHRDRAARSGPPGWAVMAEHSWQRPYRRGANPALVASPSCGVPVRPGLGEAPLKPHWIC